jgi:predicted DNA-binding transcriptional regulator AlpA
VSPTAVSTPADPLGDVVLPQQIIEALGVCRKTLYLWVQMGRFPAPHRIGRTCFWRARDVEAFLESRKKGGPENAA